MEITKTTTQENTAPNPKAAASAAAETSLLPLPAHMEIVAHRGASADAPENTVAAYKLAWAVNSDAAETDIHLTADHKIIVMHDGNAKRTTGVDVEAKDTTYDRLRALDAGSWKDPKFRSEPLPLLDDLLAILPPGKILYVEVKCGPEVLPFLDECLTRSGKRSQIVIIGFDLATMSAAKKLMPDRPVMWLRSTRKDEATGAKLSHDLGWIDLAKANGLDGLDVNSGGVTQHFADAVREAGLHLYVWTVDDVDVARQMRRLGAESLTTNKPDLMLREVK